MTAGRNTIARALTGVLVFQVALAGLLILGDSRAGLPAGLPGAAPAVPRMDTPVNPGDQRRRFSPRDIGPEREAGRGAPALPKRLTLFDHDGATYRLEGPIEPGDAARLIPQIEGSTPFPERVLLVSPGGSVADALRLGRYLRRAGIATELEDDAICYSSCPYLLAGGEARAIAPTASVGVHQHYFGQSSVLPAAFAVEDVQHGQGEVMAYLIEMGIDPAVMRHALTTPPDQIYILLPEQLTRYGFLPAAPG